MIKVIVVFVLLLVICIVDSSVFFMDEDTEKLLYGDHGKEQDDVESTFDQPASHTAEQSVDATAGQPSGLQKEPSASSPETKKAPDPKTLAMQLMEDVQKEVGNTV